MAGLANDRMTARGDAARRMRRIATGLLIAMAGVYALARTLEHRHPAWGFVRAFAEAAMVGGLADWFAVTALFRHPLGLPIPHTAIIPRNKDRIGDTLAAFLRDHFLTPTVVARRMRRIDIAAAAGRLLAHPPGGAGGGGRIRRGASRLFADMLDALDPERLGGIVRGAIADRIRRIEVAPLLGQLLAAAIAEGRHAPMVDEAVRWASRTLEANEALIRRIVHDRAGSILRWTGLDEKLATAILTGLQRLLEETAADPAHPLRARTEEGLAQLAHDLQHDPDVRARVERFKDELIDNPAVARWWQGIWEMMRAGMLRAARDPDAALAGRLGEELARLGATLQADRRIGQAINQFARRAVVGGVASYGDGIVRLVSDTVRGWDAGTLTARMEHAVGRDLQYIRINGTLVGGLVGLMLHIVALLTA